MHLLFVRRCLHQKILKGCLLFCALLLTLAALKADVPRLIRTINMEQGLPNREVFFAEQDSFGFVWIFTKSGIYKYDGYSFQNVPLQSSAELRATSYRLHGLVKTGDGMFWFLNYEYDLCKLNTLNATAEVVVYAGKKHAQIHGKINAICRGENGNMFLSTSAPEAVWEMDKGKLVHRGNTTEKNIYVKLVDRRGNIFFTNGHSLSGMQCLKKSNGKYVLVQGAELVKQVLGNYFIPALYDDESLVVMRNGTAKVLLPSTENIGRFTGQVKEDLQHNYWVFSGAHGITRVSGQDGTITAVLPEEQTRLGLRVHHLFVDRAGIVWAATSNGMFLFENYKQKFNTFLANQSLDENQFGRSVRAMCESGDYVYIGTNGLHRLHQKSGEVKEIVAKTKVYGMVPEKDILWYSDYYNRIWKYDLHSGAKKEIPMPEIIAALYKGRGNNLWCAAARNLYLVDKTSLAITEFKDDKGNAVFRNIRIYEFAEDAEGSVWLATNKGLYKVWPNGKVKFWDENSLPFHGCELYSVSCFNGAVYMGSVKKGLFVFYPKTWDVVNYSMKNGMFSNLIYSIVPMDNYIWVGTEMGLSCIVRGSGEVRNYFTGDGIAHNEFNILAHLISSEGRVFLGGLNGVTEILPAAYENIRANARLNLVSVTVFDGKTETEQNLGTILNQRRIVLDPSQRWLKVSFSLADYFHSAGNHFEYKLQGYEDNWISIGNQHEIKCNNLPAGKYKLVVRGKPGNGSWSKNLLEMDIEIEQVFYKKWSFILLFFGLVIAGVFLFFRYRISKLRANAERLEHAVKMRTEYIEKQSVELQNLNEIKSRYFANISHEFRTPLTLILGPLKQLLDKKGSGQTEIETVYNNAQKLKQMVEEVLDLSKLENGVLEISETAVDLNSLLKRVFFSYQSLAESKKIVLEYNSHLPRDKNYLLDVQVMDKIWNNLTINAIKFTNRGKVAMTVEEVENPAGMEPGNYLRFAVSDTGVGISEADLPKIFDRYFQTTDMEKKILGGTGIGLALVRELCHALGGQVLVQSTLGKGSVFEVFIPAKPALSGPEPLAMETDRSDAEDALEPMESDGIRHRILVVEDNLEMMQYICGSLEENYEVLRAFHGKEALDILQTEKVDLITSDIMMPQMDGMEFLAILKNNPRLSVIPTIMLTAKATEEDKLDALTIGVDDYIVKPFNLAELQVRIRNLIHNSLSRAAWKAENKEEDADLSAERKLLLKIQKTLQENIGNSDYNMDELADALAMSKRQMHRVITGLTGLTPLHYLREIRLNKARELLEKKQFKSIAEVAFAVGFEKPGYFSSLYQKRFGVAPSSYQ